jgi:hypothetical protein
LVVFSAGGENRLIVEAQDNVGALKAWLDVKEGEASIFKPEGSEYQLVARVQMDDWPKLAVAV